MSCLSARTGCAPTTRRSPRDWSAILQRSRGPCRQAYGAREKVATRVSSLSLVGYRLNDYSVPTTYRHRDVLVRGYVHDVVVSCGAEVIARHPRSCERHDFIFDLLHYLALIEQKINALDQAAPQALMPEDGGGRLSMSATLSPRPLIPRVIAADRREPNRAFRWR
jgi:hypothetical protein